MRAELRPGPEPLQVDAVPVIAVTTVGWLIAFVVLLAVGDRGLWLWTCLAGGGLGFVGLSLARAQYRAAARRRAGTPLEPGGASGSDTAESGPAAEPGPASGLGTASEPGSRERGGSSRPQP